MTGCNGAKITVELAFNLKLYQTEKIIRSF